MSVDLSPLPRHVTVPVGGRVRIKLPSYSGSGNAWSVGGEPDDRVARVEIELEPPVLAPGPGAATGMPPPMALANEWAVVTGLAPGETTRQLVLGRSFGLLTPTAIHDLAITVVVDR